MADPELTGALAKAVCVTVAGGYQSEHISRYQLSKAGLTSKQEHHHFFSSYSRVEVQVGPVTNILLQVHPAIKSYYMHHGLRLC